MDESLWDHLWLGDSGASIHLLSQSLIDSGHVVVVNEDFHEVRCSLASGEVLNLSRRVTVRAQFLTCDGSLVCAQLQALVTDCVCSLLSLGSLAAKGWSIGIESSGLRVSCLHGSYPRRRIRLYTYWYRNCGWLVSRSWRVTLVDGQPQLVGSLSTSLSSGSREDGRISAGSAAHPEQRGGDSSGGDNRSECGTRSSRGGNSSEFGARTRRGGSGSGAEHSRGGADSAAKSGEAGGSDRLDTREGEAAEPPSGPSGSVSEPRETELKSAVEEIVEITEAEPVLEKVNEPDLVQKETAVPKAVPKKAMPFAMAAMHKKKEKASSSGATEAGSSSTRANQGHLVEPACATASSKAFCDATVWPNHLPPPPAPLTPAPWATTPVTVSSTNSEVSLMTSSKSSRSSRRSRSRSLRDVEINIRIPK